MKAKISISTNHVSLIMENGDQIMCYQPCHKNTGKFKHIPLENKDHMMQQCARYCKQENIEIENLDSLSEDAKLLFKQYK